MQLTQYLIQAYIPVAYAEVYLGKFPFFYTPEILGVTYIPGFFCMKTPLISRILRQAPGSGFLTPRVIGVGVLANIIKMQLPNCHIDKRQTTLARTLASLILSHNRQLESNK